MSTTTEKGFGQRIRKAQDLLIYLNGFPVYNPPRTEESLSEITILINDISSLNDAEALRMQDYRLAVDNRQGAFRDKPDSIEKLLTQISGVVTAQFGKTAKQTQLIVGVIRNMRSTTLTKPKILEELETKSISQSEKSYGSLTKAFSGLIKMLTQLPGYNPSNGALVIGSLQQKLSDVRQLNDEVITKMKDLKSVKTARREKYEELHERIGRIKSYIKGHYGTSSPEYKAVMSLKM